MFKTKERALFELLCIEKISLYNDFHDTHCDLVSAEQEPPSAEQEPTECPDGYSSSLQNSCYKVLRDQVTRSEAADACAADDAHLADIKTQGEQDFISQLLSENRLREVWFGLSAPEPGGELLWSDGSSLEFTAWSSDGRDQPDENENCVLMKQMKRSDRSPQYYWAVRECDMEYSFICEYEQTQEATKGTNLLLFFCFG